MFLLIKVLKDVIKLFCVVWLNVLNWKYLIFLFLVFSIFVFCMGDIIIFFDVRVFVSILLFVNLKLKVEDWLFLVGKSVLLSVFIFVCVLLLIKLILFICKSDVFWGIIVRVVGDFGFVYFIINWCGGVLLINFYENL